MHTYYNINFSIQSLSYDQIYELEIREGLFKKIKKEIWEGDLIKLGGEFFFMEEMKQILIKIFSDPKEYIENNLIFILFKKKSI